MNKIFTAISSLLIVMGIKGQIPVKKETSKIPISHADTISPKKVFPKVESKAAKDSKVYPKVEHKVAESKIAESKIFPKVESKIQTKATVIPKVEHKIDHKDAGKTVIPKVEHKISNQ